MVWIAQLDSLATRVEMMGFSLILAGALGNCVDRIRFGHVIDFIDVYISIYHWPVFNLADSAICVGGALLLYDAIVKRQNGLT